MLKWRDGKVLICLAAIAVLLFISILLDLSWASSNLSLSDVWNVLIGRGTWANNLIVKDNSLRVAIGVFVGMGLAASGCVMQALFRNPMASPYLIGLSSGASLGAAIGILLPLQVISSLFVVPALSFATCFATMLIVYSMSRVGGRTNTETLLLTGIAISAMLSAFVSFLTFISGDKLESVVFWSMGSLSRATIEQILIAAPLIVIGIMMMFSYSKDLNAIMLGDDFALDLGIEVNRTRLILLIASTLTVAASVAFVGTIGFVGLIIPHIFRIILGPDNRILIPVSAFGGAAFLVICDYISHIFSNYYGVLPIGVLTAMIGAPYFLYLLKRRKKSVGWS